MVRQCRLDSQHGRPLARIDGPAAPHDLGHGPRPPIAHRGAQAAHEHGILEVGRRVDAREGLLEGEYLPQEDAEGVDVGLEAVTQVQPDLGRHVPRSAAPVVDEAVGVALVLLGEADGEAEVEQLDDSVGVEADLGIVRTA